VLNVLEESHLYKENFKNTTLAFKEDSGKREARLKINQKEKNKIKRLITKIDNAISDQEVAKVITSKSKSSIEQTIKALRKERDQQEEKLEQVTNAIENDKKSDVWVDWVNKFGESVANLRKEDLLDKEKNEFLRGVVYRIVVEEIDTQEQKLTLLFNQAYYNDSLVWNDVNKKSKGYTLKRGKKTKKVSINTANLKKKAYS